MAVGVGVSTAEVGHDEAAVGAGMGDEAPLVSTGTEEPRPEHGVPAEVEEEGKGAAAPLEGPPPVITVEGEVEARGEDQKRAEAAAEEEEEEGEKWLGHYSSAQSILIVGDGDFSFSLALATAFGSGANLVATSLDTYEDLKQKYSQAESNITELKRLGATVLHGVNAKEMRFHTDLKNRRFDRIVFNFPHAGFKGKEDYMHMINLHKELVWGFFRNACRLVRRYGEVHVTHKTGHPYDSWDLENLASEGSLALVGKVAFRKEDYPGYNQKRGDSERSDEPFNLSFSYTFKFQIGDLKKLKKMNGKRAGLIPNLGDCNADRGQLHPLPPVEARPWHHFPPPANRGRMLMPSQPYIVDKWQQPGFPPNSDGMVGGPYFHKQETCHPMVSMPGPGLNDFPSPLPMARIPFPDLLAPQEQPWYQHRTIPDQPGDDSYFVAQEHQMSVQRYYEMQRQVIPRATNWTRTPLLEHRQRDGESVEKQEWLRGLVQLYGRQ